MYGYSYDQLFLAVFLVLLVVALLHLLLSGVDD